MTLIDDALGYAAVGLRVFPCHSIEDGRCSCRRDGCPSPGKHPRTLTGSKSATTDEKQIREWWTMWPTANIAIATGDGIFALDVDRRPDKDGTLWLEALRHELPPTAEQVTPSGGRHLLYRHPPHLRVSNSTDALCRGVDVRGEGGYVMAAPSTHLLGEYEWEDGPEFIVDAPAWLLEQIASSRARAERGPEKWRISLPLPQERAEEIRSALQHLDPDPRDTWLRVGMAIHSEYASDAGFALWCQWSEGSEKYDHATQRHTWDRLDSYGGVTLASIFAEANAAGWRWVDAPKVETPDVVPYEPPQAAGEFPDELIARGRVGMIGEMADWFDACSIRRQPLASMVSAYCAAGALYGRHYETETGLRANLYALVLLPSGAGKESARACVKNLFTKAGLDRLLGGEDLASGAGLLAALERNPSALFLLDEIGGLLEKIGARRAGSWERDIGTTLMRLHSSASSTYLGKEAAGRERAPINQPHAVVYGTSTPGQVFDALQSRDVLSGFLNRMLVFVGPSDPPPRVRPEAKKTKPPDSLLQLVRWCAEEGERASAGGNLQGIGRSDPICVSVPEAHGVAEVWDSLDELCRDRVAAGDVPELWSRCLEQAMRLALIRALSQDQAHPGIGRDDAQWGADVASWCIGRLSHDIGERVSDTAHERTVNEVLRIVRSARLGVKVSDLTRRTKHLTRRERDEAVATLIEAGYIREERASTGGRPARVLFPASLVH